MADLSTEIRYIKGIGEKKAQAFNKLGVFSLFDLISFFPRRYDDRSIMRDITDLADGESACIRAVVADTPRLIRVRRGMEMVRFRAYDDSGAVEITYFNQNYMKDSVKQGESYVFYGKMQVAGTRRTMANPICEREGSGKGVTGRIVPVYPMTAGINQRTILSAVRQGLDECGAQVPDVLPPSVRERNRLAQAAYAFENIHFPADFNALELARRRLIFEELFVLACALGTMRRERVRESGIVIDSADVNEFYSSLPFSPTGAQRRAVEDAARDMASGQLMNRLVQGDVGSGKTLVAAALIYLTAKSGYMSAFMAPTEILTQQHYETMQHMLSPYGVRVGILTGSMKAREKRLVRETIAAGGYDLVVGTHSLFSDDVSYPSLGLVVTDEQHRFGVNQRSALIAKGARPHVLVMSATPIPRTLALIMYGDLDVSIINEMPPGRQKVDTFAVDEGYRARLNGFIRKQVEEGRQVFVVCPKVEEDEEEEASQSNAPKLKSAQEHAKMLAETFPDLKVACVHGKLKPKEKDSIMLDVVSGETNILVATTVIEVGVDVPNASLIIVENAERFGLSQLHQLRGRVGRGKHKSYCVLVSDNKNEEVKARLKIMTQTSDGFRISEEDLRLRGPGDFFGQRQHGLPAMHVADLGADVQVLQKAQDEAARVLGEDPNLSKPENVPLHERVSRLFTLSADSFN